MKKTNNKGFSLVELIIVIAIMAILAGAIAPALIRYIDKSRKSNDVSAAKTNKTAVETAMSNEDTYELLTTNAGGSVTDADGNTIAYSADVEISQGVTTGSTGNGVKVNSAVTISSNANALTEAQAEIGKNIGEKTPKVKYKKDAKTGNAVTGTTTWVVYTTAGGSVVSGVMAGSTFYQLAPEVSKYYQ